jgi:uncharacterized membrane protein YkgB
MKRTTWMTRIFAIIAAILVSAGIWTAVAGTVPGTRTTAGTAVTNVSFSQSDDFLTRTSPSAQNSVPSYAAPRYRTRAS